MKHMKLITILAFSFFLFASSLYAENLKVGIILPLTGPIAEYGVASRNGIELAKIVKPELFRDIEFVYEDSQYDPKLALSAYRKMRSDISIKVIYNWGSNPSAPLIPIAEKEKFPLFAADFSTQPFKNIHNVVAFAPTSIQLGVKLNEVLKKRNFKKLAILSVENLYINGILDGLYESMGEDQKIVIQEKVLATDSDFRSHIAKLKSRDFDALGVMLYAGQIQNLYKNLQAIHFSKPTFGSDFMESRNEIKMSGRLIEGAIYPHLKVTEEYYDLYKKNFNDDSQVTYSGTAYDFVMMLAKLRQADASFYENYLEHIPTLDKYEGVMGRYTYEVSSNFGKRLYPPLFVKTIRDGFYEIID